MLFVNHRPFAVFLQRRTCREGGPPVVRPLIDLELREKKRACCAQREEADDTKCKVSGQTMTSEVRSNTRIGPSDTTVFGMLPSRPE